MKITEELDMVDLCLYHKKKKMLIVGDIHLGYEEELRKKGVFVPLFQFQRTYNRLKRVLDSVEVKKIILLGDLKHEFGTISESEWRHCLKIIDLFLEKGKLILVRGNHDTILDPIAKKRGLTTRKNYSEGEMFFTHGDVIPEIPKGIKTIIIGNEHPAVSIRKGSRAETYKCFLKGKYKKKILIVLPSFNQVTIGSDVLKEEMLSPFLKQDLSGFEVFIVSKGIFRFGIVKDLLGL